MFPMSTIKDKLGNAWHKEAGQQRILTSGVKGAHLCIPFQCGVCWLWNLKGWDPIDRKDKFYLACIKHTNLDAMVGKLPLTIVAHLRERTMVVSNASFCEQDTIVSAKGSLPFDQCSWDGFGS
jgi:hypothetical protein